MKKVALTLVSIMAAAAFAPEASAVPAFARQTGMACDACHFQSYPILTGFGKSFKSGGFTMMGSQSLVEGEHGLSIPSTLNSAIYLQSRYQKTGGTDAAGTYSSHTGRIDVPDEFAVFFAGRVSEGIGSLTEVNIGSGSAGLAGTKLVFSNDLGNMKSLVSVFTGGLGPQYGFDLFATGATANGRPIENKQTFSAIYLGTDTDASGITLGVVSEDFHVTVTPWAQGFATSNSGVDATTLGGTYIRAAYTPTIAGFETGLGVQMYSGNAVKGITGASTTNVNKATIIDAQAQGEVAGMPLGVYFSYGMAPKSSASETNAYNGSSVADVSHMGILADLGVIPHVLSLQLGYATAKTGGADAVTAAAAVGGSVTDVVNLGTATVAGSAEVASQTDNAIVIGARYKLRQNVKIAIAYSMFSGTKYDAAGSDKSLMNLTLSTGF